MGALREAWRKPGRPRRARPSAQRRSAIVLRPWRSWNPFSPAGREWDLPTAGGRPGLAGLKTGRYSFIADGVRKFVRKNPRLLGRGRRDGRGSG